MDWMDGKQVARGVLANLKQRTEALATRGITPTLGILLVGDDARSKSYIRAKQRAAERIGIAVQFIELDASATLVAIRAQLASWNADLAIHGIIVQLPLPGPLADREGEVLAAIDPAKDVDGLHPDNQAALGDGHPTVIPPTPLGVMRLLATYDVPLQGRPVTLVGYGKLVGRPLAELLKQAGAKLTIVRRSTEHPAELIRGAEVVIAAVGHPNLVTPDMVSDEAVLVDVGLTEIDGTLHGDISGEAKTKARLATPVPGGVGPMTVAMILENVVAATEDTI